MNRKVKFILVWITATGLWVVCAATIPGPTWSGIGPGWFIGAIVAVLTWTYADEVKPALERLRNRLAIRRLRRYSAFAEER